MNSELLKKTKDFTTKNEECVDWVKCTWCEEYMFIDKYEEDCPNCGCREGSLTWVDEENQEIIKP